MSGFRYRLAGPADDLALRAVLRRTPMAGSVELAFLREPSFFGAERIGNLESQTIACCDRGTGEIVGLGTRAVRRAYVDGEPTEVGYLSMLRGVPEARRGTGLARGYRFLRALHSDGRVPFYVTTVLAENTVAADLLTSGRAGLPVYEPLGTLVTYLLPIRRKRRAPRAFGARPRAAIHVERATPESLSETVACLESWNRKHQFAPAYTIADLSGKTGLLPGFRTGNLYVALQDGGVAGTLGLWDQMAVKQTVVTGYAPWLAAARALYNAAMTLRGWPSLPPVGAKIGSVYAAFASAPGGEAVFRALLERALLDWSGQGYDYLTLGLREADPLSRVVAPLASRAIRSTVYAVYWASDPQPRFDRAAPVHLEVATL